ncbi:MAG: hypothetical protein WCR52_04570 [Bacteroidota bacterium]
MIRILLLTAFLYFTCYTSNAQIGEFYKAEPFPGKYFIAATGFGLQPGQKSIQSSCLALNQYERVLSPTKAWGMGMVPTFVLNGDLSYIPMWITGRVHYRLGPGRRTILNAQTWIVDLPGGAEAGAVLSSLTFGKADCNLNVGLGLGFATDRTKTDLTNEEGRSTYTLMIPGFTLSGCVRANHKWWLVTENIVAMRTGTLLPLSITGARRKFGRTAVDLAFLYCRPGPALSELLPNRHILLPWFSFHASF